MSMLLQTQSPPPARPGDSVAGGDGPVNGQLLTALNEEGGLAEDLDAEAVRLRVDQSAIQGRKSADGKRYYRQALVSGSMKSLRALKRSHEHHPQCLETRLILFRRGIWTLSTHCADSANVRYETSRFCREAGLNIDSELRVARSTPDGRRRDLTQHLILSVPRYMSIDSLDAFARLWEVEFDGSATIYPGIALCAAR